MIQKRTLASVALIILVALSVPVAAEDGETFELLGKTFDSWQDYVLSPEFETAGMRCGTHEPFAIPERFDGPDAPGHCSLGNTTPDPMYDPGPVYRIPVAVHIITHDNGTTGDISDAMVQSQIDVLNEDYNAILGTPGEDGTYVAIEFYLATEDPDGFPTTGITRTANTTWYNDQDEQGFKTALMWDPHRYLNFYLNNTAYLGYAWFPQWGVGGWQDGIVVTWRAFGRPSPMYPYNQGRTATHEVGHWLGLLHPFQGGCGNPNLCYTTADLICDTEPDASSTFGCPAGSTSCGGERVPVENYMEYSDDACMTKFTVEQMRRARCTLTSYRPSVYEEVDTVTFQDGFESGSTAEWSYTGP